MLNNGAVSLCLPVSQVLLFFLHTRGANLEISAGCTYRIEATGRCARRMEPYSWMITPSRVLASHGRQSISVNHCTTTWSSLSVFFAFSLAFVTNEGIHETGHWLAHRAYGASVGIVLDPFGVSHIVGGAASSSPLTVTSLAGPLLSLVCSAIVFAALWHWRNRWTAGVLFMFPIALIQEGVTFSLGLLTPGGDASHVVAWGIPAPALAVVGALLLLAGLALLALLLPLIGVSTDHKSGWTLLTISSGMLGLMLLRFALLIGFRSGAVVEATVPLVFSILLALAATALFRPIQRTRFAKQRSVPQCPTGGSIGLHFLLAAGTVITQMAIPNWRRLWEWARHLTHGALRK